MKKELENYIQEILSDRPTIPAIMDEETFFDTICEIYDENIENFDEIREKNLKNISIFGIENDDKTTFTIKTAKDFIEQISLYPNAKKHIFVLRDIDTDSSTHASQNSLLKAIEECPDYAVVILVVKNYKNLLETILSRAILLVGENNHEPLSDEIKKNLEKFLHGDKRDFLEFLYNNTLSKDEAIEILTLVFWRVNSEVQNDCKQAIFSLKNTNENPRNILESFFLGSMA